MDKYKGKCSPFLFLHRFHYFLAYSILYRSIFNLRLIWALSFIFSSSSTYSDEAGSTAEDYGSLYASAVGQWMDTGGVFHTVEQYLHSGTSRSLFLVSRGRYPVSHAPFSLGSAFIRCWSPMIRTDLVVVPLFCFENILHRTLNSSTQRSGSLVNWCS